MKSRRSPTKKVPLRVKDIIPPRSIVELIKTDRKTPLWKNKVGSRYRIGYYNPHHGLTDIFLVDECGEYWSMIDSEYLDNYFKIIKVSTEKDLFGKNRSRLGKLRKKL